MHLLKVLSLCVLLHVSVAGCGHRDEKASGAENGLSEVIAAESGAVGMPEIPTVLNSPEERAEWLVSHFWDRLDMHRPEETRDTAFMEQSMANFLGMVPYADSVSVKAGVRSVVEKTSQDEPTLWLLDEVAAKYLDDPQSPMRSEELYILFLKEFTSDNMPDLLRSRSERRLKRALMNRPGSVAPDFPLLMSDGRNSTLHKEIGSDTLVVMFYDPDCEHCHKIITSLTDGQILLGHKLLMVDIMQSADLSLPQTVALPSDWKLGRSLKDLEAKPDYVFPALPSFYLMGPGSKILLKDFSIASN